MQTIMEDSLMLVIPYWKHGTFPLTQYLFVLDRVKLRSKVPCSVHNNTDKKVASRNI